MCEFRSRVGGGSYPIRSGDGQIAQMMHEAKYGVPRCTRCGVAMDTSSCGCEHGMCPKCKSKVNSYGNCRFCGSEVQWVSGDKYAVCPECGKVLETETIGVL
jgi:predicted RNA-binding Zn-ribbon protein involved in translation (DUF1610 family)